MLGLARGRRLALALLLPGAVAATQLSGCAEGPDQRSTGSVASATVGRGAASDVPIPSTPIVIDGQVEDWPEDAALVADDKYVYFRVTVDEADPAPLQAAPRTLALWIDLDGDPSTGRRHATPPPATELGVDYEIEFSPIYQGKPGTGVRVIDATDEGDPREVSHAAIDLVTAPTHASSWYEGRIARSAMGEDALDARAARAMFLVLDESGPTDMWSDAMETGLPRLAPAQGFDLDIPPRGVDAVRVMSWNVLRNAPVNNAGPFERVFQVVDPDIILLQEWDYTPAQLRGWFTALAPSPTPWQAHSRPEAGVGIVSRYPLTPLFDELLMMPDPDGGEDERHVRCAAAIVHTPVGDVGVASLHLKCCGTAGGREDRIRMAEARALNDALESRFAEYGVPTRVIGGDVNLVGGREPLDILSEGLDADGSDLAIANPRVMGDAAPYTWWDADSRFPPGRLDYLLVSDASADLVRTFVFDTARLSVRSLAAIGLDPSDSRASDHMPVVVDVRLRQMGE